MILTLKLSRGTGRILKYNGGYSAGFVYLKPFSRPGDQAGASLVANELNGQFEYGIDTYYKYFLFDWISVSASLQAYYTQSNQVAFIPGVRAMLTY